MIDKDSEYQVNLFKLINKEGSKKLMIGLRPIIRKYL